MFPLRSRGVRVGIAAISISLLGLGLPATFAAADEDDDCLLAGNVWVVVEHDNGTVTGCATEFGTGFEALTSAGIEFTEAGGFVQTIAGEPTEAGAQDWWSYWSATPTDDGAPAQWVSYLVGAADSEPQPGTVEGWRLAHSWTDAPAPATQVILGDDATPAPTVTASVSATPTPVPSNSATPSATATPTVAATASSTPAPATPGLPSTGV